MEKPHHPRLNPPLLERVLARQSSGWNPVSSETTVQDALRCMMEHHLGAVAVVDGEQVVGLLTDRDWVHYSARHDRSAAQTQVRETMTPGVVTARPTATVAEGLALLTAAQGRYLLVQEGSRLRGLVSLTELLAETVAYQERVFQELALDQIVLFAQGTYSC